MEPSVKVDIMGASEEDLRALASFVNSLVPPSRDEVIALLEERGVQASLPLRRYNTHQLRNLERNTRK